jgi:hypothetical protein
MESREFMDYGFEEVIREIVPSRLGLRLGIDGATVTAVTVRPCKKLKNMYPPPGCFLCKA